MVEAIRGLLRSSSSRHRPGQLAAGLAMGMVCGLLPKLSVAFCTVGLTCLLLPIHLPLAAMACVLVALSTDMVAPWAGHLGICSLTHPQFAEIWLALDALPVIRWLGLHNSVVHGSLLIGLGLWLPVFLLSKPIARILAPADQGADGRPDPDFAHELKPAIAQVFHSALQLPPPMPAAAAETIGSSPTASQPSCQQSNWQQPPGRDQQAHEVASQEAESYNQLQQLLRSCDDNEASDLSIEQVAHRASRITEYVDDILSLCDPGRPAPAASSNLQAEPLTSGTVEPGVGEMLKRHEQHFVTNGIVPAVPETYSRPVAGDERQQEALRYLLHHLKAFKDKV